MQRCRIVMDTDIALTQTGASVLQRRPNARDPTRTEGAPIANIFLRQRCSPSQLPLPLHRVSNSHIELSRRAAVSRSYRFHAFVRRLPYKPPPLPASVCSLLSRILWFRRPVHLHNTRLRKMILVLQLGDIRLRPLRICAIRSRHAMLLRARRLYILRRW
jgi:hypothetical protein